MNARLYDPLLARFLAPDPYVNSSMANDFNRYIYGRNNPMMYTDPSGESWKSFWRDFGNAFVRDFKREFLSGGPGFEIGYNSMGGGFINSTYNGAAFGPSVGISNSGQLTTGSSQDGFHTMKPIAPKIDQAAMQMYQATKEMSYEHNEEQEYTNNTYNKSFQPYETTSNFFANRYKNVFSFISTPEGGYSLSLLSGGLNINRIVSPISGVISASNPIYQNSINQISSNEATYDFATSIISTGVSAAFSPAAGFVSGSVFEGIKVGFKFLYPVAEQWTTPYINQLNNRVISIALPNY